MVNTLKIFLSHLYFFFLKTLSSIVNFSTELLIFLQEINLTKIYLLTEIFFPFCKPIFSLLTVSFAVQKFQFHEIPLTNYWSYFLGNKCPTQKSFPEPISWSILNFSSRSFRISGITLRSLIFCGLTCVQVVREGSNFIFLYVYIQFSPFIKMFSLLQSKFTAFGENSDGSDLIREVSLCSLWWLTQKLTTDQNVENKSLRRAQPQMRHLYSTPPLQGSGTIMEDLKMQR